MKKVIEIVKLEFGLELRSKYAMGGLMLYVVSTIFLTYLSMKSDMSDKMWNTLFWIILLFASTQAIARSFTQDSRGKSLYWYSICSPQQLVFARIIYNSVITIVLGVLALLFYSLLLGNPALDLPMYLLAVVLAGIGFSSTFTLVAAIAAQTGNNVTLMSILGFPIILPFLTTLIVFSQKAMEGKDWVIASPYAFVLMLLIVAVGALSYLLFPYLWRD